MKYKFNAFIASLLLFTVFSLTIIPAMAATGFYTNINGTKVSSPIKAQVAPNGASAKCKDGTYSFSKHRSGTCFWT